MIRILERFIRKIAREEIATERRFVAKRAELFAPHPEPVVRAKPKGRS